MSNISEWSPTAGLNVSSPPDGWPEGMPRSAVNDGAREIQAAVARWYRDVNGLLVSAGTSEDLTLTTNVGYTDLADIGQLSFRAHVASEGGGTTLAVDLLTPKDLVLRDGTDLFIGDIRQGQLVHVFYNADEDRFELTNDPGDRPGTVKSWAGADEPPGWLFCWGQEVARAAYPYLFGVIGETHGSGDGSTTFNLPDLRGRVVAYKDDMGGFAAGRLQSIMDGDVLGEDGGVESKAITTANLPSHSHDQQGSFLSGNESVGHVHFFSDNVTFNDNTWVGSVSTTSGLVNGGGAFSAISSVTGNQGTLTGEVSAFTSDISVNHKHTTTISGATTNTGSGTFVGVVQPTLIPNGIIKT